MGKYDKPVILTRHPLRGLEYGLHWTHANADGSSVLIGEESRRTIAGVVVNTPLGTAWLYFRRWKYTWRSP